MLATDQRVIAAALGPPLSFAKSATTSLDLSTNKAAIQFCWRTGTLPRSVLEFPSLQVLIAPGAGIIYLEEWITQLKELREVYLQGNEITTWPHFLSVLPNLKVLVLDGNPCLELQLQKSCSFRNAFFDLDANPTSLKPKKLPLDVVRGPVWKPALVKKTLANKRHGMYRGGIFTVSAPGLDREDLLTILGPSRLEKRRGKMPPILLNSDLGRAVDTPIQRKQSRLILELINGLFTLTTVPFELPFDYTLSVDADLDQFILGEACQVLQQQVGKFIADERQFLSRIDESIQIFLSNSVPHMFVNELSAMLDSFPQIYLLHMKWLKRLHKTYKKRILGRSLDIQRKGLGQICVSYLEYLQQGDLECYRDYARTYISSQWRLWCYINHEHQFDEDQIDNAVRLSEWLFRQATDNKSHSLEHATNYLDLPINRLDDIDAFFNRIIRFNVPEATAVCSALRLVRSDVNTSIEESRRVLGISRLSAGYRLSHKEKCLVSKYIWDALLDVQMRVYLEPGSHKFQTFDTLCGTASSKSAVCEVFSSGQSMLRLIRSGENIRVWDETVGQLICSFKHEDMHIRVINQNLVVVFKPVDDLYFCRLVSFATIEVNRERKVTSEKAFLTAFHDGK